jgi:hypothetical protein
MQKRTKQRNQDAEILAEQEKVLAQIAKLSVVYMALPLTRDQLEEIRAARAQIPDPERDAEIAAAVLRAKKRFAAIAFATKQYADTNALVL